MRAAAIALLEKAFGRLRPELWTYFSFAANLDAAVATTFDVPGPLLSLSDTLATAKELRKYGAPTSLVPFGDYESGDYACFDTDSLSVVFWDHETRGTSALHDDLGTALSRMWVGPLSKSHKKKKPVGRA